LRCVGEWCFDKIHRLVKYFGIFAQAMKGAWGGHVYYIEICSGPGRCSPRDGWEQDGTALAVLRDRRFANVERAQFFDNDPEAVKVLQRRIDALGQAHKAQALVGDYNDPASILKRIDETCSRGLYLILVDPTRCDVPFKTITALKNGLNSVDFLVNVALGTDFNRCARQVVLDRGFAETRDRYERFLGAEGFLAGPDVMAACDRPEALRRLFARRYLESMRGIGLEYADTKPVRQYYYLLFASGDARGLEFWRKACKYDPSGQGTLDL